jgi:tetratricopeptide (TPR) repeat protein
LSVIALVTSATGAEKAATSETPAPVTAKNDALTRSGLEHYYDLDYDGAIHDFERTLAAHPEDPFAVNHLLAAVFFRELYQAGALESSAYANNNFLSNRAPVQISAKTDQRIKELMQRALDLSEKQIAGDPRDANAYYARGVTRGMQSTYLALVKKSWFAALGSAKDARHDHEKVLELDPQYDDARLVVGLHSYIVGSLPWPIRVLAHVVGESGNKANGLRDLEAASRGGGDAAVDAQVVLALMLRREQRFAEALEVARGLTATHPHNFLFALEQANLLKDAGKATEAIASYRQVLSKAEHQQFHDPHLEFAYYGLGNTLRGQRDFAGAAAAYASVEGLPHANLDIRRRSQLAAGEMYDVLNQRERAVKMYQSVIASGEGSDQAQRAREHLNRPYQN